MSRIYEALQRAEAERETGHEEGPIRAVMTRPSVLSSLQLEDERIGAPMPVVVQERPSDVVPLDDTLLTNVPRRAWTLKDEQFPSLHKRGSAVEQFRSLRSRVQEFRAANKLKTLLVCSGLPQEGKSFIATNLAVSLALYKNSKVLLIDGDLRRSTLHHYFGAESNPGLTDYLASRATLTEIMQQPDTSISPESASRIINNLVFIPSGEGGDKSSDLIGNRKFDELIATASSHFDWIIVDSSPVIPVSDAVSLARPCDAVMLVARAGVTTFPVAQRAQEEFKASKIIGFVLNAVKKPPVLGNYYGYDGTGA